MTAALVRLLFIKNETLGAFLAGVYLGIVLVLTLWGLS